MTSRNRLVGGPRHPRTVHDREPVPHRLAVVEHRLLLREVGHPGHADDADVGDPGQRVQGAGDSARTGHVVDRNDVGKVSAVAEEAAHGVGRLSSWSSPKFRAYGVQFVTRTGLSGVTSAFSTFPISAAVLVPTPAIGPGVFAARRWSRGPPSRWPWS
ncbi:hypothetical protein [Streptomyces sp. NPDC006134]|uniref:hypothetical protein n=1 Tax=Streptomyces sp. NPDC006134 TaxID=3154467 RepID=UPI0033F175E1